MTYEETKKRRHELDRIFGKADEINECVHLSVPKPTTGPSACELSELLELTAAS